VSGFAAAVRRVLLELVDLLEDGGVPYLIMGGVAVPIWGVPRATYDIDLTLSVDDEGLLDFFRRARSAGFEVDPPFEEGFRDRLRGMEKVQLAWWGDAARRVEVDVFLVTTSYQEVAFQRRRRVKIDGRDARVLGPADLVLHKLTAGRPKDLADVQNILAIQGIPDEAYLREWAERLGVSEALALALARAGLSPG